MLSRRSFVPAALSVLATGPVCAASNSFQDFLVSLRADARRAGVSAGTVSQALSGLQPNQKVLDRDRHQPEFTLTWAQYRAMLITDQRITNGRVAYQQNRALFGRVQERYAVDPGVIIG